MFVSGAYAVGESPESVNQAWKMRQLVSDPVLAVGPANGIVESSAALSAEVEIGEDPAGFFTETTTTVKFSGVPVVRVSVSVLPVAYRYSER
jgi:hypothetical protein